MTDLKRRYNTKDVDMLTTVDTIVDSAIADKIYLQSKRSTWADPFFSKLKDRIKLAVETFLGVDNVKDLRAATQVVLSIQMPALLDLAEVKVQLEEDFKATPARRDEILNTLGFKSFYVPARKKDQEALVNLLYRFKTNLIPVLKTEIVASGTSAATLDTITAYADTLKNANVIQEGYKGSSTEITAEALLEFNQIYEQIVSISKISTKFYKDNQPKKDQFNFSKVSKKLNFTKK